MAQYFVHTMEIVDTDKIAEKPKRAFKGVWIPKEIWLDKGLTWMEKLMLTEINSLDNDDGCYASNNYFADFFNLTPGRISQIINGLKNKGYISIEYDKKGKQIEKRVVRILNRGIKYSKEGIKYSKEGYLENYKENNIDINNTDNNIKYIGSQSSPNTSSSPSTAKTSARGKGKDKELFEEIYNYWSSKKHVMKNKRETAWDSWKGKALKRAKTYTLEEIKKAIDNYDTMLGKVRARPEDYWWNVKYALWEFLASDKGMIKFFELDEMYFMHGAAKKEAMRIADLERGLI